MWLRSGVFLLCAFLLWAFNSASQSDSSKVYRHRKIVVGVGSAGLAAGSLIYLNQAWYADYHTGKFHFFNDNGEWMQMDKLGHLFTTYQTGRLMMDAFRWAGSRRATEIWVGGMIGWAYMGAIEIMDGYSEGWGFSWGDILANSIGSGLAISQRCLWNEQRLQVKFSYYPSDLAQYNPELLGDSWYTRLIKDYNGQTYWLSFSPMTFTSRCPRFPRWINLAVGYGAYGMVSAVGGTTVTVSDDLTKWVEPERRIYFSLDLNLQKLPLKSKLLRKVFSVLNVLKVPFPALGFSKSGVQFYALK